MEIITANTRLARVLQQSHDSEQVRKGLAAWTAPAILPLNAWLERTWNAWLCRTTSSKPVQLLSSAHERAVWEDIIRQSDAGNELLQIAATADAAFDAFRLLHEWHVPLDDRSWQDSKDTETFRGWAEEFYRLCEKRNWLSNARLTEFVAARINAGEIPVSPHVQLAGFTELTPAQERLFAAMRQRGANVELRPTPAPGGERSAVRVGFVGPQDEIGAAARWARRLIERCVETGTPPSIGIVVPELSAWRSTIERLFSEELHAGGRLVPDQDSQRAFNISLGPSFSEYPLVQTALLILRMSQPAAIPFDDVSSFLRSPFIANATAGITTNALFEVQLRRLREPSLSLAEISAHAPVGLKPALDRWRREIANMPAKQLPGEWATTFSSLLKSVGWPGDRPLNSADYQTTAAWNEMVSEFFTLDSATGPITRVAALSLLQRLASERQFQPESESAPIQILGVFETSGLTFDHLWIVGMHDGAWPRSRNPNPFLPLSLQRAGNLPQSSAQRELEFTKLLSNQLMESSPDVVLSYPKKDGDADLRPSPLFAAVPEMVVPEMDADALRLPAAEGHAHLLYASSRIEKIADDLAPPWSGAKFRGGTAIFTLQAACPFQAFAKVRLGAEPLESAENGLSALDRGNLIHDVFRRIWNELGSHGTLIETPMPNLNAIVQDEVALAIAAMAVKKRALQEVRFAAIEQERLERLTHEWLDLEKQRLPFKVVHQEEQRQVSVGGIDLKIRADRIDKLEDGSHVVIDYKTSMHRSTEWDGARPDEPQLPLYAITNDVLWGGVVFGVVKPGELKFTGLTEADGVIPGVKAGVGDDALSHRLPAWRVVLEKLASDFRNGDAMVDPKKPAQTCRLCRLQGLCRISEAAMDGPETLEESRVD